VGGEWGSENRRRSKGGTECVVTKKGRGGTVFEGKKKENSTSNQKPKEGTQRKKTLKNLKKKKTYSRRGKELTTVKMRTFASEGETAQEGGGTGKKRLIEKTKAGRGIPRTT